MHYGLARPFLIGGYMTMAVLMGLWMDAMDRRFGVAPSAANGWLAATVSALGWPIAAPIGMAAIADGGWGRWIRCGKLP